MADSFPYFGEIRPFLSRVPDDDWLPWDGRRLDRGQYEVLFHLLGTRFGSGPGYFNLPDLRGRVPAGAAPDHRRFVGDTSGDEGDPDEAIPYSVVNWGICIHGQFPPSDR